MIEVGGNFGTITVGGNLEASTGGGMQVAGNATTVNVTGGGGVSTTGTFTLNSGGVFSIGRNVTTLSVGSNLALYQGSQFQVSGNLTSLTVGGSVQTSQGGGINVAGNLGTLSVTGNIQGKGNNDIDVGDDLLQLTVLGGGNGVPGLQTVNILATTSILGLDIRNGIAGSRIQAGYLINGGTPGAGSNAWNIGPNGALTLSSVDPKMGQIAVLNSTIQAGYEITNVTIGGDVVSDRPVSPGSPVTRLVAGENLAGQYVPNGVIDSFQIVGNLINSVVAASVGPNPNTGYYDQPAGTIEVGFVSATVPGALRTNTQTTSTSTTTISNGTATTSANSSTTTTPGSNSTTVTTNTSAPATGTTTAGTTTTTSTTTVTSIPVSTASNPVSVQTGSAANHISDVSIQVATGPGAPANPIQLAQLQGSPLPVFTGPPFAIAGDPELAAVLQGGVINPSVAPKLQLVPPEAAAGTQLPLPSKPTVLGSVITTAPGLSGTDYAGVFAANTNGVLIGPLPTSTPVSPAP
jgi:hypothetical protein